MSEAEDVFDNVYSQYSNIIVKVKGLSTNVINRFTKKSLDFVYIDGCHLYEAVLQDIKTYLPTIKDGGYIGGHDYWTDKHFGINQAVDEMFGKPDKIYQDSSWIKHL